MAIGIIDQFKAIQIHIKKGQGLVVIYFCNTIIQVIEKITAVVEVSQGIHIGQIAEGVIFFDQLVIDLVELKGPGGDDRFQLGIKSQLFF